MTLEEAFIEAIKAGKNVQICIGDKTYINSRTNLDNLNFKELKGLINEVHTYFDDLWGQKERLKNSLVETCEKVCRWAPEYCSDYDKAINLISKLEHFEKVMAKIQKLIEKLEEH